jgi:hypothetical protein
MGVTPSWTTEFLPFVPNRFEPPVSPASSSSSSEADDTSYQSNQANEPPPYLNQEPGNHYIEDSGVEDRDLEYGMDIVTLADATPPVD